MIEASGSSQTIRQRYGVGYYRVQTQSSGASSGTTMHFLHDDHPGSVDLVTGVESGHSERSAAICFSGWVD